MGYHCLLSDSVVIWSVGHVRLLATPWTVDCQASLFMQFSRQENGVGSHALFQRILQPRDWNWTSCIAGRFFTGWATSEALGKNLAANAGDRRDVGLIPGSGRFLEEGKATHFSILAWRIPWTEEACRLGSIVLQRVGHNWRNSIQWNLQLHWGT